MSTVKIAVVTGANKGIGFAIVRGLCKQFRGIVYLTSRDVERGQKAVSELQNDGLAPKFHQLDVTDPNSVTNFRDYIKEKYGGIDLLINNAAIAFKNKATEPVAIQAKETLRVNYFSLVSTCNILFPLLRDGARVVNVSSSSGLLINIPSEELRRKLTDPNLTIEELSNLMQQYVDAATEGTQGQKWGHSSYSVSKVGVNALTKIQQRMLKERSKLILSILIRINNV